MRKNSPCQLYIEALVRETAYHLCCLQTSQCPRDGSYSRSAALYRLACFALQECCPKSADQFIASTHKPEIMEE